MAFMFVRFCILVMTVSLLPVSTLFAQTNADSSEGDNSHRDANPIRALIVDGQNGYHPHWPKITAMVKSYLLETGKFEVDVCRSRFMMNGAMEKDFPLNDGKEYQDFKDARTDPEFKPDFSSYDVVINNFGFGAAPWPQETQKAFVGFMKHGGGLVSIHAADNCFPEWKEYNLMTGLGGWGNRNEKSGPYVYYNKAGELVRDKAKGKGGSHGPQHQFQVVIRDEEHPIMKGLPNTFRHAQDELYQQLRGPAENMTILATAFAAPENKGTGRHEPMWMVINYGKGRTFHTTFGHSDQACECVSFITSIQRGTEWAATGKVTLPVPEDFPGIDEPSVRKFNAAREVETATKR